MFKRKKKRKRTKMSLFSSFLHPLNEQPLAKSWPRSGTRTGTASGCWPPSRSRSPACPPRRGSACCTSSRPPRRPRPGCSTPRTRCFRRRSREVRRERVAVGAVVGPAKPLTVPLTSLMKAEQSPWPICMARPMQSEVAPGKFLFFLKRGDRVEMMVEEGEERERKKRKRERERERERE